MGPEGTYRVSGTVSKIPAGQTVKIAVHAWPNNYVMANFPGGGSLPKLGEATVTVDGSFDIKLDAKPDFNESRKWVNAKLDAQYGYINMQLVVHVGDKSYPLNVPVFVGNLDALSPADNPVSTPPDPITPLPDSENVMITYQVIREDIQLCGTERGPEHEDGNRIVTAIPAKAST